MSEMKNLKQEILTGSARLVAGNKHPFDRVKYMSDYMYLNKAFTFQLAKSKISEKKLLQNFKKKYQDYRDKWTNISKIYADKKNFDDPSNLYPPLSIDIETASICDLACPHCSREYIITPDKIMNFDLQKVS